MYLENHKSAKTIKEYLEKFDLKYNDILSQQFESKTLDVLVSAIRIDNYKFPNLTFYGGSNDIDFKKIAYAGIINEINYQLEKSETYFTKMYNFINDSNIRIR
jgi:hypothetical protein